MSLSELIAGVEAHEKTLTVVNASPSAVADVRERFADRNLRVTATSTADGQPGEFVTLSDDGAVVTATDLDSFLATLSGREPPPGPETRGAIFEHIDETLFTSWAIDRMVTASREIEDRAWRVGRGSLHAGFQTLSTLEGELDRYDRLGESDTDVHAYAVPDVEPPRNTTFRLHLDRGEEIATSWFVVFDDGVDDARTTQKCALLAEEREERAFYGFWTYDPSTVEYIVDHLESRYGVVTQ